MKKTQNSGGFFRSLSYMTVSLILFALSFILTAVLIVRAALTNGRITAAEGILGITALICSVLGFIVPLYGHFIVRIDSKADWRIGAAANGLLMLILVFLYFLGVR